MAADLSADIQTIKDTEGVVDSATALIEAFSARIQAAVDAALANGATAEQLQPVTDELTAMKSKADKLAAAVAANA